MLPVLKNDQEKLIDFIDLLGRPNFKDFAIVINDVEKMYLKQAFAHCDFDSKLDSESGFRFRSLFNKHTV